MVYLLSGDGIILVFIVPYIGRVEVLPCFGVSEHMLLREIIFGGG